MLKMEKSLYLTTLPRSSSSDRFDHGVECAFGLQFRSSSFFLRGVCLPRVLRPYPTVLPISPESGKSKTLRSSLLVSDSASNRAKLTHWRNWSTWPRNTIRQLVLRGRRPVLRGGSRRCTQRTVSDGRGCGALPDKPFGSSVRESVYRQTVQTFGGALDLNYTIFDFGERAGRIAATRTELLAANFAFNDTHRKIIYQVAQAYYRLLNATGQEDAARASLTTLRPHNKPPRIV